MGDKLDRMLQPGEEVLYRTPRAVSPSLLRTYALVVLLVGAAVAILLMEVDWGNKFTLLPSLVLGILLIIAARAEFRSTQAAVTERRVLWAKANAMRTQSVDLADIERIETLAWTVRVASKGDRVVLLGHPGYVPELGHALARATGLPPPWLPGRPGEIAIKALLFAIVAGALAGLFLAAKGFAAAGWVPTPFPQCLLFVLPGLLVAVAGAIAGDLLGLFALRLVLGPAELRALIRFHAPPPEQAGFWPARFHKRLSELVVGPPPRPNDPGVAENGQ